MTSLDETTLVESEKPMNEIIAILLPAIMMVESSGNINVKPGDGGRAIGAYQIHRAYWIDGCKELKVDWPYEYAKQPKYAKQIVTAYLKRYGRHYEKTEKKKATAEVLAKIHNGGLYGWKNPNTGKYWEKVRKAMK